LTYLLFLIDVLGDCGHRTAGAVLESGDGLLNKYDGSHGEVVKKGKVDDLNVQKV
jgi:hypothetical protein